MESWEKGLACMVAIVMVIGMLGVAGLIKNAELKQDKTNSSANKIQNTKMETTTPMAFNANGNGQPDDISKIKDQNKADVSGMIDTNHDGTPDHDTAIQTYSSKDIEGQAKNYSNPWNQGTSSDASINNMKQPTWDDNTIQNDGFDQVIGYNNSMMGSTQAAIQTSNPIHGGIEPSTPVTVPKLEDNKNPLDNIDTWFEGTKDTRLCAEKYKPTLFTDLSNINQYNAKNTSKQWTWTETLNYSGMDKAMKNGRLYYKAVGTYSDNTGIDLEYKLVIIKEAVLDMKNGSWTYLYGYQGGDEQMIYTTNNQVIYEGVGCWVLRISDKNSDGKPDMMDLKFNGYQTVDTDQDARIEFVRNVSADLVLYDNSSNGKAEFGYAFIFVYQSWDGNHDGWPEYQGILEISYLARDPTDDGIIDSTQLAIRGYECWAPVKKVDSDGLIIPQYQRGMVLGFNVTDSNSDGTNDTANANFIGFATMDKNMTGNPDQIAMLVISYKANNPMADKKMANQTLELWALDATDNNNDGRFEEQNTTILVFQTEDTTGIHKITEQTAFVAGAHTIDANGDGYNESASIFVGAYKSVDANGDGNPEQVTADTWSYQYIDPKENGHPQWQRATVFTICENDSNSNGHFEEKTAFFAGYDAYDNNSDGKMSYQALIIAGYKYNDSNDDGNPNYEKAFVLAYLQKDDNEDGNPEVVKVLTANVECYDNNSNGHFEKNITTIGYYEGYDNNSDGVMDYQKYVLVHYEADSSNDNGFMDNISVIIKVVVIP